MTKQNLLETTYFLSLINRFFMPYVWMTKKRIGSNFSLQNFKPILTKKTLLFDLIFSINLVMVDI